MRRKDPDRRCNGGLGAIRPWCGENAEFIVTDKDGMQCYVCADHTDDHHKEPIDEWFIRHGLPAPQYLDEPNLDETSRLLESF